MGSMVDLMTLVTAPIILQQVTYYSISLIAKVLIAFKASIFFFLVNHFIDACLYLLGLDLNVKIKFTYFVQEITDSKKVF